MRCPPENCACPITQIFSLRCSWLHGWCKTTASAPSQIPVILPHHCSVKAYLPGTGDTMIQEHPAPGSQFDTPSGPIDFQTSRLSNITFTSSVDNATTFKPFLLFAIAIPSLNSRSLVNTYWKHLLKTSAISSGFSTVFPSTLTFVISSLVSKFSIYEFVK